MPAQGGWVNLIGGLLNACLNLTKMRAALGAYELYVGGGWGVGGGGMGMKYRARMSYPGVPAGTVFYPKVNEYGVTIYHPALIANTAGDATLYLLHTEDVVNSCYFEPIHERLTSDEEDEAARQYIWVPKKGSNVFRINSSFIVVGQNWSGISYDWFCFRCGMTFRTKSEAVQAAKLMMQDYLLI